MSLAGPLIFGVGLLLLIGGVDRWIRVLGAFDAAIAVALMWYEVTR